MAEILILYYSPGGTIAEMANVIARGVEQVTGMQARVRTVPAVAPVTAAPAANTATSGAPFASHQDLLECSGLILG